jgi:hypothetical protein
VKRLFLIVALAGCASAPPPRDGKVDVVWNRVDDANAACRQLSGRPELYRILGCSKWNEVRSDGSHVCAIYAPMPRSERDTERLATLGHELMHCFDGNWHDRWGRMSGEEQRAATGSSSGGSATPSTAD